MLSPEVCDRATRRGRCSRPATSTFLFPFAAATLTERYCTYHGRDYAEGLRRAGISVRVLGHPLVVAAYADAAVSNATGPAVDGTSRSIGASTLLDTNERRPSRMAAMRSAGAWEAPTHDR